MNRATTIWQRMGALLLAMVLVVGMLPVSARAEMLGWRLADANRLEVTLERRQVGTQYTYSVNFGQSKVGANDAAYYWCDSLNAAKGQTDDDEIYTKFKEVTATDDEGNPVSYTFDTTHSSITSDNLDVGLKVEVDGLWVKVTIPEGAAQVDLDTSLQDTVTDMGWRYTATWATKTTLPATVQENVPFEVTWEYMCSEVQGTGSDGKYMSCGLVDAAAVPSFDDTFTGGIVEQLDDGRYLLTEKTGNTLTLDRTVKTGGMTRGYETRAANAVDTVFENIQFNGTNAVADATTYVKGDTITLSVRCGIEDATLMPSGYNWTKGENGTWTAIVEDESVHSFNGKTYTVKADNITMAFNGDPVAYQDGISTYVEFELNQEPVSGIKSVTVFDEPLDYDEENDRWVLVAQTLGGQSVTLKVTSNVGSEVSDSVTVIEELAVSVTPANDPVDGFTNKDELKVEASYVGTLAINGDTIDVNKTSYAIEEGITKYSGKHWVYTDKLNRIVEGDITVCTVDAEAPVISVSANGSNLEDLSGYRGQETTITVSIADSGSGLDAEQSWVKYTLADQSEQIAALNDANEASFVLRNEQNLKKISIYAVDKMANEAEKNLTGSLIVDETVPEISLSVSAMTDGSANAITGTLENAGKTWLVLESPVTTQADATTTFTIKAIATDNLGMANMEGWTLENGVWEKDITVANVANHSEVPITLSVPVVKDNAGHSPAFLELPIGENQSLTLEKNGDSYEAIVYIDRRYPGDGAGVPTVTFTTTAAHKNIVEDTVKLYNEKTLEFAVNVQDNGSGMLGATLVLDQDGTLKFLNGNSTNLGSGEYSIALASVETVPGEDNQLKLLLTVKDKVNNAYTYHHVFAFDNQAPRLTFAFDKEYNHEEGGAYYFNDNVTATVTVDELNFANESTKVEQTGGTLEQNGQVYTVKFETEGEKKLAASSIDLAENDSGRLTHSIGETFILDKGAPTILVTQTTEDANGAKHNGDVHYYNGTVTYSIEIADDYLTNDGGTAKVEYTINGVTTTKALSDLEANEDNTVYTHSFTLEDGQTLTALSVYAMDNAGNAFARHSSSNMAFGEDGVVTVGTVVVDTTAPVVTITKNADSVNTVNHADLYDGEVTYTITVEDANLDSQSTGALYTGTYDVTMADSGTKENEITWENPYEGTFTVEEAQRLTDAILTITDAAGNVPTAVENEQWKVAGDSVIYAGNDVVVDSTDPVAELSFNCLTEGVELKGYYTNGNVAYLQISTPTTTDTLAEVPEKVQVQATLTITDNNLSIAEGVTNALAQASGWELSCEPDATEINDSNAKAVYTKTLEVETNKTATIDLMFQIQDLANNQLTEEKTSVAPINDTVPGDFLTVAEGKLTGTVTLDRRQPTSVDTDIPAIQLNTDAEAAHTMSDGNALYDSDSIPTYELEVHDGVEGEDKENSGLYSVTSNHSADDFLTIEDVEETFEDSYVRSYTEDIAVAQNGDALGEQNNATITVEAEDNVGNKITHQKTFGVDILAPRVTVTCDNDDVRNEGYSDTEMGFFNKARVATITVEELNFDESRTKITSEGGGTISDWTHNGTIHTATVSYTTDGTYSLSVEVWDLAGNVTTDEDVAYTMKQPKNFVVDMKNPTILVTMTTNGEEGVSGENGSLIYYYNGKGYQEKEGIVTFAFQIADAHLTQGAGSAQISYTIENYITDEIVHEVVKLDELKSNENGKNYTYSFELKDGQMLTALSVDAVDNAGNAFVRNPSSNVQFGEDGVVRVGTVVVDTTAPVVTITKNATPVDTVDNVDLYNGVATYTITVEDANLDPQSTGSVYTGTYTYADTDGKTHENQITWEKPYEGSFVVEDGQRLTDVILTIKDAAANAAIVADGITEWEVNTVNAEKITYVGNNVVVDTTVPVAELSFNCLTDGVTLDKYYTNNGVAYLKISHPTTSETLDDVPEEVQVQATLTITDRNLSTKTGVKYALANSGLAGDWVLSGDADYTAINTNTASVTYTRTLTVKTNATEAVDLNFQIQDLMNHLLTEENASVAAINETTLDMDKFFKVDGGKLTGTITLDRRQPTTLDVDIPEIELVISPDPVAQVENTDMYNADSLNLYLDIHDGEEGEEKDKENSGLYEVTWTLGADEFIAGIKSNSWNREDHENVYQRSYKESVDLTVNDGEQNNIPYTATAEDNVGNKITYQKEFSVDTLAPRVTVTCDNNDVLNERYFKEARVATITVEELNFDESRTTITSEGGGTISDWTHDGTTHTATVSYTTDETYSLSVEVTDLAGNTTGDEEVNYDGMTCPKDFVVDLTLPEIHVYYNPADPSGTHENVLFYDTEQRVTVTIDELNFNAEEVEFVQDGETKGPDLGAFTDDDESHSASVTFDEGNKYHFTVNYTDLAGNRAAEYISNTFSVDLHAPKIEVKPEIYLDGMQLVADELELEITVTDEEHNLADCNLVLTHVDNAFEQTIVSGDRYYYTSSTEEGNRVTFVFKDFPYEKVYDGIYTVELEAEDHAGNEVKLTPPIQFSMNRFGSTFIYGNEFTKNYLTAGDDGVVYRNSIDGNLVIQEINPTRVYSDEKKQAEGSTLTMVVNGQSTVLVQGKDYKMTVEEFGSADANWYVYTYEIYPDVFKDGKDLVNGRYSIVLYGVDEAGNNNTNTLETVNGNQEYTAKIEFVLDTIAPVIITTGIESGEIYDATNKQMEIEIVDSTPSVIQVYVNDQVVSLSKIGDALPADSVWLVQDEVTGIYTLNVTEQNTLFGTQNVQIKALDAANNPSEAEVNGFTITTNWFVRYINSGWMMITLAILAAVILMIVIVSKKKKKVAA